MCAIAAVFDFAGRPIDPLGLRRMADVQQHRGPDGEGAVLFATRAGEAAWWERDAPPRAAADAGLAHRRLAIIELSALGRQPMEDAEGGLWITYNGEIYNYVELMAELRALGHRFRSGSDTEVILHAYRAWGPACVERFNGIFAFALWDVRRRTLVCARDRLGVKPLYYRRDGSRLVVASEIKAILAYDGARPVANVPAVADYLCYSFVPSTETLFEGITKLPAGHRLVASPDGIAIEPYWQPRLEPADGEDDTALVEELRALLDDAARLQVRSDVPIGAHLSGGIDSSGISCLAARHVERLRTFTVRFPEGGWFDESPYARLVAGAIGSDHHEMTPSAEDVANLLPRIVWHLDHPIEGPAVVGKFHVAELVGAHVKVVLGGQGGDELFGGYDWYVKALFTAGCNGGWGAIGDRGWLSFAAASLRDESRSRLARSLWNNVGHSDVGAIFRRNWSRLAPGEERRLVRRELFDGAATAERRFAVAFDALPEREPADRMFRMDVAHYLEALLHSEDRLSMAFSVESRVPLLDHRIVELAGRAGFRRKTIPGRTKDLLRRALAGTVPAPILARRDKRGFPTPVEGWLRDPRLRLVERFVLEGGPFAAALFDREGVRRFARRRFTLGSGWSEVVWRLVSLGAWGERFGVRV
jgi:asparagine synthase (glutamine-hydrolysing)